MFNLRLARQAIVVARRWRSGPGWGQLIKVAVACGQYC